MRIQLSEHFTYSKLLRFVFPSVVMMIFTSIYSVVDGLFVSNYAGKTALAAINLIYPLLMMLGALGFMTGAGGSALVAKTLGEGKREQANQIFSMLVYITILGGLILTVLGQIFIRPIALLLGARGAMADDCVLYGRIVLSALTAFMLQNVFQSFLVTAEKPHLGLAVTAAAGVANMLLDYLFVAALHWGLAGAAIATALSQAVGGLTPLVYFLRRNSSLLRLTRAPFDGGALVKTCTNGSSEFMSNLSSSLVSILYNFQLMRLAGEDGVAAYGVIMYVDFVFIAIFLGYSIGSAPIVGYHYGAGDRRELKNLFRKSLRLTALTGLSMTILSEAVALPLTRVFVGYDRGLMDMTCHGFRLHSLTFLLCGFNIFGSAFFTALNNGVISAVISFLRTLVFQIASVLVLPVFLKLDGIWLSVVLAEFLALCVTVWFLAGKRKKYGYA